MGKAEEGMLAGSLLVVDVVDVVDVVVLVDVVEADMRGIKKFPVEMGLR